MAPFCNLFMERPSYLQICVWWLWTDGGSLKRPYEPSPFDSCSHPVKSVTVISDSSVLGQPSSLTEPLNTAVKQQQIVFEPLPPDQNDHTAVAGEMRRPSTGSIAVSAGGLVVKQEGRPVIGSTPTVLPDVTPSIVPLPVTYAAGILDRPAAVGAAGLQLGAHNVNAGLGYVAHNTVPPCHSAAVPLNPSVIQFLQQQAAAVQTGSATAAAPSLAGTELTRNTVSNILAAAAAAQKSAVQPPSEENVNIQMLMNLLNNHGDGKPPSGGVTALPGVGGVQWTPAAPAHSSNAAPSSQTHSPFIVQNFTTVAAAVPQNLTGNQLVFSLNHHGGTSFAGAPSIVSYGTAPAVVSSMLLANPVTSSPQPLAHSLPVSDQVLNLTLHSSGQRMDINAPDSYTARDGAPQPSSFTQLEQPAAFVASAAAEKAAPAFCDITAVSVAAASTYAEPMAVASNFASDTQPPPAKTMLCMTDGGAEAVNQVLVAQHDAHSFAGNVIVRMDVTSSPHPTAKPVETSTTELPRDMKAAAAAGIISASLESPSLFLTGNNNPMLGETSSRPAPQNPVEMQGFSSPTSMLGMDICNGHLTGLSVSPAEPAALNVVSSPADESSANSMSSNLQQSLAELLDLQQQLNVPVSQPVPVQPAVVLDSPLARELPTVASESMQWVSSTASHPRTTAAELPAPASDVVLASANVGATINLLTAADVLNNSTYGQEANHEVFYSSPPQPATSYAVVIGTAGNSQDTSPASWTQPSYAALTANENTHNDIKHEELSTAGDVLDLLTSMSTATGRPAAESQLYSQQSAAEVTSDFFNNSDTTSASTSSSTLPATDSATQSVIYVVNQVGMDSTGAAPEPAAQPITYHIVTANQLPNCNHSSDINIVQYATSPQMTPAAAGSDIHSPTSTSFRVLTADAGTPTSTDPSAGGIQFQLAQPMSFGSESHCCITCCCF